MENRAHAIAAGLFTILLTAGVVFAAMWFSGETYEKAVYLLESRLPVTGLNVQSAVRFRGVDVGKVESIEFDANGDVTGPALVWKITGGQIVTDRTISIEEMQSLAKRID